MTTDMELLFGEKGPLAKNIPNYAPRQQQIELANAIDRSIETKVPLIGEAPTGVGKSFAALVPAFKWIKKNDAPVVVVTSSIILQEQYYNKDIPFLEKLFNIHTGAVLLKGKSNYLCLHKGINRQVSASSSEDAQDLVRIKEWAQKTKTGDMSELDFTPSYVAWSEFAVVDEHECARKDCPLFDNCFYYTRRREMATAKLIICNYHYFFTALKSDKMLPSNIQAVIFDEGHEIPSIARDMNELTYNQYAYKRLNQMLATAQKKLQAEGRSASIAEEIELAPMLDSLKKLLSDVAKFYYDERPDNKEKWTLRYSQKVELIKMGHEHLGRLHDTIELLTEHLAENGLNNDYRDAWPEYYSEGQIAWQYALENYLEGLVTRYNTAYFLFHADGQDSLSKDTIVWIEEVEKGNVALRLKPTECARLTGNIFAQKPEERPILLMNATPIVISATLSVNGKFEHLKEDLGIDRRINEVLVTSPFDLPNNLLWYLPSDMPDGNRPEHLPACLYEMERIIKVAGGRTLCLFTSFSALNHAAHHLRRVLPKDITVFVQGEIPKQKIIDTLRSDPKTVILGTKSFFTGVDIQGQNLSAVIIDKLPFPIAGEPVNEWLMGAPKGFWKYTLPDTIIALKQGFGRLNRTTEDKGVVAVLDGRLATASYKSHIFESFDFKVSSTRDFNRVQNYLEAVIDE